ncbi:MAG: helix-turn-helix transcriptional regulator [Cytophagales bacterium]|nr:helix-turn-helix transcriptional regulator [Cytophagales bacterium]
MENVIGNVRTIDRLELEHLQRIFNYLPEGGVADEDLPPTLHTREMKEFNFKDTKVLDFWLKGGQEVEFQTENLTMVGMGFQLSGRGKTAFPGYRDYFEQGLMTYNLIFQRSLNSHHLLYGPEDFRFLQIAFTPARFLELIASSTVLTEKYTRVLAEEDLFILKGTNAKITPPLMQSLDALRHIDYHNPLAEMLAEALVMSIIVHVHAPDDALPEPREARLVREVKNYLEENYLESHPIKQLSRQFGINEFDLKREFKARYNQTIFGYVQQLRMEKAKEGLLAGKSIKEVAFEIGYEHPHHFSTAFRKWYNIPPSRLK